MSRQKPKREIYARLADVAQALGHAHRLELLELIAQGERSVEDLSALSELTFANTSRHLQILRRARLVETRRSGKRVFYALNGTAEVVGLMRALGRVGERNMAEITRVLDLYFKSRDAMEPVSRKELRSRVAAGLVTVLDVRPEDEFALGHIRGARNIPVGDLHRRLAELPRNQEIVAYCRGPYCIFAVEAVEALRAKGFRAKRLLDGFPEWEAAGLPVDGTA